MLIKQLDEQITEIITGIDRLSDEAELHLINRQYIADRLEKLQQMQVDMVSTLHGLQAIVTDALPR